MKEINGLYCWKKGEKAKLSENFNTTEFECHGSADGEEQYISVELIKFLEKVRSVFQRPIKINSGYRTKIYNAQVGGASDSQHCKGMAADFAPLLKPEFNKELDRLIKIVDKLSPGGMGIYSSWVHADVRTGPKARWRG